MSDERLAQARAWMRQDPDHETRDELAAVITRAASGDETAIADLDDRFSTRLAFGTAGLRGALGAGSNRMNRVLVAQAAAGFASYLRERAHGGTPTVIIGYDGRRNSRVFATDSAELTSATRRERMWPWLKPSDAGPLQSISHIGVSRI